MFKKIMTAAIASAMMIVGVVAVGAQDGEGERGPRSGRGFGGGSELVTEYTGLEREALREALQDGATLGELIEAAGNSTDDFVAASIAELETRLDEAVAEGRLTEDEAADKLAEAETRIEARLDGTFERPEGEGRRGGRGNGPRGGNADTTVDPDV